MRLLEAICTTTVECDIKVQRSQIELCAPAWFPQAPIVLPSREPMDRRCSTVFQKPIEDACAYLVWFKVLFEFGLGQIEGKVPNEGRVRGLGRERDFLTRGISTGVAAVYYVAKKKTSREHSGQGIGGAPARTRSARKSRAPEAVICFGSS